MRFCSIMHAVHVWAVIQPSILSRATCEPSYACIQSCSCCGAQDSVGGYLKNYNLSLSRLLLEQNVDVPALDFTVQVSGSLRIVID